MKRIISVIIILLLLLIMHINSFAQDVPAPPTDKREYWLIMEGRDGLYYYIDSHDPIKVAVGGDQLLIKRYRIFYHTSWGWAGYETRDVERYIHFVTIYESNHRLAYEDNSGYFDDGKLWADVDIVLPPDGFIDNIEIFNISVITKFTKFVTDEEVQKMRIDVRLNGGPVQGEHEIIYNRMRMSGSYSINELSFSIEVPPGENTIDVIYNYDGIEIGRDSVTITRLLGFVDEDGDGLDDRTGQPEYERYSIDIDTDNIGDNIYTVLKNTYNSFTAVFAFLRQVFSMFPAPIVAISTGFISLLVVLRLLGR